ncbi:MAG: diacylglycerol kinase family lipid kinase [Pseudomonadales bacterium]|nr:diacylglycerol kinase family lipid kinase [Pseudomonadales bacterium]
MKVKVVVNPKAGNGKALTAWPEISQKLEKAIGPYDIEFTTGKQSATLITRDALKSGFDQIVSVGGDGTFNEVLNGFFEEDRPINPEAILSLIIQGTGGDICKSLGFSNDTDEAVERIAKGKTQTCDVGKVQFLGHSGEMEERYFGNITSFGMGGLVAQNVNRSTFTKRLGARAPFIFSIIKTGLLYRNKKITISVDDQPEEEHCIRNLVVANGKYHAGGMKVAPDAIMDDGLFDIVVMGDFGIIDGIQSIPRFYKGSHLCMKKISSLRGKTLELKSEAEVYMEVDGECPGRLPATLSLLPKAVKLNV